MTFIVEFIQQSRIVDSVIVDDAIHASHAIDLAWERTSADEDAVARARPLPTMVAA